MSQSSNHLLTVTITQSVSGGHLRTAISQSNRAPLGCCGTGYSHHGCVADKSVATVWHYRGSMNQNLREMFLAPCWVCATKQVLEANGCIYMSSTYSSASMWPLFQYRVLTFVVLVVCLAGQLFPCLTCYKWQIHINNTGFLDELKIHILKLYI